MGKAKVKGNSKKEWTISGSHLSIPNSIRGILVGFLKWKTALVSHILHFGKCRFKNYCNKFITLKLKEETSILIFCFEQSSAAGF